MDVKPTHYMPRLLDATLEKRLANFGAVEVTGPKFCGKTWTSRAHAASIIHVDDAATIRMVELDETLALEGERPHVIDEWQNVPKIWDAVRRRIDEEANTPGQFILTGSSTVDMTHVFHSGAGRIARMRMRPMSLFESGHSNGSVSLQGLFAGEFKTKPEETDVRALATLICQGGWPALLHRESVAVGELPAQYLDALFEISAAQAGLNEHLARRVAVSLARNIGKTPTYKTLYADVFESEVPDAKNADTIAYQKLNPYINFFKDQFFIEEQTGWDAPLKSKSRVRSKPRHSFADPSLAAALLGVSPERLLYDTQLFGNLFEEMCLRDVRVYASAMGQIPEPAVCYYADSDGLEVDIVVELCDGRWGAFEVKLSEDKVPDAQRNLLRLRDKILRNPAAKNREPAFLAVLVGKATFCRRTPDGIYVVPLTSLTA